MVKIETRCIIPIRRTFGRIPWHVIPELRITLQGAATWWIHCHDSRATAGCNNSIRHIENRFSPYLFLLLFFNAVWALTSGGCRIVSDTLVVWAVSTSSNNNNIYCRNRNTIIPKLAPLILSSHSWLPSPPDPQAVFDLSKKQCGIVSAKIRSPLGESGDRVLGEGQRPLPPASRKLPKLGPGQSFWGIYCSGNAYKVINVWHITSILLKPTHPQANNFGHQWGIILNQ